MLRDPGELAPLLRAVEECDRLLILGDLIELRHGPERDALRVAEEPLRQIGAALGPEREVVIVPGNHDHHLLDSWFARHARLAPVPALGLEHELAFERDDTLGVLSAWLAPARVRAAYPGVWLREDVYATHGHYADLHFSVPTLERLAAAVMTKLIGLPERRLRTAEDYELALAPIYAWIHALAQRVDPDTGGHLHGGSVRGWQALTGERRSLRQRALAAGFPVLVATLNRAGLGPLRPELSGPALRRAGLRGLETVLERLDVEARYVIFGHTHRAGPQPEDEIGEWRTTRGASLFNAGCWIREPSFLGPDPARSPYRPGFSVRVGEEGAPELVNLLDSVPSLRTQSPV